MFARSVRRALWAVVASLAGLSALGACGGSGKVQPLDGAVAEPPLVVADQQLPEALSDEPFTFRAAPGELLAVYFGYTQCPDLCPTTMADIKVALGEIGSPGAERVTVVMVTVDPERDSPKLLDAYLSGFFGTEHSVAVRTTDLEQLKTVEGAFLATSNVTKNNAGVQVEHTATTSIVDDQGVVVVQWPFGTSPESMAHDLKILLARTSSAAKGKAA